MSNLIGTFIGSRSHFGAKVAKVCFVSYDPTLLLRAYSDGYPFRSSIKRADFIHAMIDNCWSIGFRSCQEHRRYSSSSKARCPQLPYFTLLLFQLVVHFATGLVKPKVRVIGTFISSEARKKRRVTRI